MNEPDSFTAFFVDEEFKAAVRQVPYSFLPDHDVLIEVHYSSLNYKDALSATGKNRVTRKYPHIPGIDAVGVVLQDRSGRYQQGERVLVTGYDLGTNTPGGYGSLTRVPAEWLVSVPERLSLEHAMVAGTAGFTAVYGMERLQRELLTPDSGTVLVTGATGGVGSFAVFALSKFGYEVTAATRKDKRNLLTELGAAQIISSDKLLASSDRPLLSRQWAGAIETVGGEMLDSVIRQLDEKGAIACCGNILGMELSTNVLPFILRGISLVGIDSAGCKQPLRNRIWETIGSLDFNKLPDGYFKTISPEEIPYEIDRILSGDQTGRVVISHK